LTVGGWVSTRLQTPDPDNKYEHKKGVRVKAKSKFDRLLVGTSAIAMAVASAIAVAQENAQKEAENSANEAQAEDSDVTTVVVTGIRAALETAAETKRRADTFVDSVTATDVASLPDMSVAEALQRVPGVTVTRFPFGGASPDFPSPEGRGNLIRGLGFVRSEFNGRDAFSANGGRALDWSSIPPELVGAIDVYKNQSADLIEGGIGGTINLRTLEPFDRTGHIVAFTADGTYADLGEKWAPSYSAMAGNRWDTDSAGEFGILASYSRSKLTSMINGWQQGAPTPRINPSISEPAGPGKFAGVSADQIEAYVPGFQLRTNEVDRDRTSYYLATQWQKDKVRATLKYARVENQIDSLEHTTEWFPDHDGGPRVTMSDLTFNDNWSTPGIATCSGPGGQPTAPGDCEVMIPASRLMESGMVSDTGESWAGAYGLGVGTLGIGKHENATTEDFSLNVKVNATERLFLEFDAQLTKADAQFTEVWGGGTFLANAFTEPDLENPRIRFEIDPRQGFNMGNTRQGGSGNVPTPTSTMDPNGAFWLFAADSFREGTGELYALRTDGKFDISEDSWFRAVRFGARLSEREQNNKEIGLNWGGIAPAWAGGYGVFSHMDTPAYEMVDFSNFFRGGVVQGPNNAFPYIRGDLLMNYGAFRNYIDNEPDLAGNHPWTPRGNLDGTGIYRPEDISDITERNESAYLRLDFGHDIGSNGMSIDGNIGVRFVKTGLDSAGAFSYLPFNADTQTPSTPDAPRTPDAESRDDPRDFLPETTVFLEQLATPIVVDQEDTKWLPSFNLKWNLNENMLVRVGASKAVTRPNVQDLRASQRVEANTTRVNFPTITDPLDPLFGVDRGAQDIRLNRIVITRGNPNLQPTTALNLDLSYEWYFEGGYFSAAVFQKELKNIISTGDQQVSTITLDGQTVDVVYNGQINQAKADLYGFEVAYQKFFDELPGWMSHLGVQTNYTNIQAEGDPPGNGVDANGDGIADDLTTNFRFGVRDLLGQSEHIANFVGIYQDDNMELRLAYNWRSEYLTTYRDWVTGNPIYTAAGGFLDGSFRYDFNDNFQVSASISNILDKKEKAYMLLNEQGQTAPRFAFLNDRRMVLGMRYQF
jgi:iron complex outermembrane recepter protein